MLGLQKDGCDGWGLPRLPHTLASLPVTANPHCTNVVPQVGIKRRMSQAPALEELHSELQEVNDIDEVLQHAAQGEADSL